MYFWYYLHFFYFDLEKFISKNCKDIFFYQRFVHLGENTSKYCSPIIEVHVHETVFFIFAIFTLGIWDIIQNT